MFIDTSLQLLSIIERFGYCLLRQLHVALAYNLKRENADEVAGEEVEQLKDDGPTLVAPPVLKEATKTDTYAEWDTQETIDAVRTALEQRHRVSLVEANEEAFQRFKELRPDIVFNVAEGFHGASREAQIPAILEMLGIPYTGSDPITLGICLDKSRAKEILSYYGIPNPSFRVVSSLADLHENGYLYPSIVKPLHEGSSKGIFNNSIVNDFAYLRAEVEKIVGEYDQPALIEQFLPGREFTVAMLGNHPDVKTLPVVEIRFDSLPPGVNPIYSYEAKWIWDQLEHPIDVHECPARITSELQRKIEHVCREAFRVLGCRDWCRIDIRLDGRGEPHVIELNPLPGILPNPEEHSCFPQAARVAGIEYNTMINSVLDAAVRRYGLA